MLSPQPVIDSPAQNKDFSMVKILVLISITSIAAFFTGYFTVNPNFVFGLISFSCFWVFFTLQTFLIKSWKKILLAILFEAVMVIVPIIFTLNFVLSLPFVFGWIVFLALLLSAYNAGRHKISDSLHFPIWRASRVVLVDIFTGTLLFVSMVYIFNIGPVSGLGSGGKIANDILIMPALKVIAPDFQANGSAEDALRAIALKSLRAQSGFDALPPATQNNYIEQGVAQLRKTVEDKIGPIDVKATPIEAIYKASYVQVMSLESMNRFYAIIISTLVLWFIIRSLAIFLFIPLAALVFFIYETLIVTNVISIQYESRSREIIVMK